MNSGKTMKQADLKTIDVLTLLPQRPPFVMIDMLTYFDMQVTTTQMTVSRDNLFMEESGILNPCAMVENIAQTCAARLGYINCYIYKRGLRLGFIGGIKNLKVIRPVRLGETLTTTIEVMEEVMQLTLVNATIRVDDEVVMTAEMKIAASN